MGSSTRHVFGCGLKYISRNSCLLHHPCSCVTIEILCGTEANGLLKSFRQPVCQKEEKTGGAATPEPP